MSSDEGLSRRGFFARLKATVTAPEPAPPPAEDTAFDPPPFDVATMLANLEDGQAPTPHAPTIPVLRPPGAIQEPEFLATCTRCEACLKACPHGAIVLAPERFREASGTPMLDPMTSPCRMCADTPCVQACQPQALRRVEGVAVFRMGKARISPADCLAHQGSFCSVCVERCPVSGAIKVEAGRPRIDAQHCTGCGICHHMCPSPWNAILILPELRRT